MCVFIADDNPAPCNVIIYIHVYILLCIVLCVLLLFVHNWTYFSHAPCNVIDMYIYIHGIYIAVYVYCYCLYTIDVIEHTFTLGYSNFISTPSTCSG